MSLLNATGSANNIMLLRGSSLTVSGTGTLHADNATVNLAAANSSCCAGTIRMRMPLY